MPGPKPRLFVEVGQRFGSGVVIDPEIRIPVADRPNGRRGARLLCDCGRTYDVLLGNLLAGQESCGCIKPDNRKLFIEVGQRFGRGVVIDPEIRILTPSRPYGTRGARLLCECGNLYEATLTHLLDGLVQSCGCLHRDNLIAMRYTHGLSKHPLYGTWEMMLARCEDPDHMSYHNYGGRDIKVCKRWHDVAAFITDIEREIGPRPEDRYPSGWPMYTLDRVDNDSDYEPGKVRWATQSEQLRNKRPLPHSSYERNRGSDGRFIKAA